MPTLMPSLVKYFLTMGAILFVGLIGLNAVMEPGGPGPRIVQDTAKSKLVRHDPRASLVERLREEEAAQKASGKAEASPVQPATTAVSTPPVAPVPAQPVAPARANVTQAAAVAQPQPSEACPGRATRGAGTGCGSASAAPRPSKRACRADRHSDRGRSPCEPRRGGKSRVRKSTQEARCPGASARQDDRGSLRFAPAGPVLLWAAPGLRLRASAAAASAFWAVQPEPGRLFRRQRVVTLRRAA